MMMKGGNKILARSLMTQTLEAVKRKQFEKYHAASAEKQATIERNPYTIFHQALKNCEPVIGLVPILKGGHFYQVSGQGGKAGLLMCEMVGVEGGI